MIRTLNTTTGKYEAEPIRNYLVETVDKIELNSIIAKKIITNLNLELIAKDELLAQASQCRSITQVRKLLS